MKEFITSSSIQTKRLGQDFAQEFKGGEIICLTGDLGAGKTTFTQGLLKGLGIKGPYTSPTFAILKAYKAKSRKVYQEKNTRSSVISHQSLQVNHIDAYRITPKDLIELGFKDFAGNENSITIIEWPENVKKIIPTEAVWIQFEWINDKQRKIIIKK